jgi:hypothetical protein
LRVRAQHLPADPADVHAEIRPFQQPKIVRVDHRWLPIFGRWCFTRGRSGSLWRSGRPGRARPRMPQEQTEAGNSKCGCAGSNSGSGRGHLSILVGGLPASCRSRRPCWNRGRNVRHPTSYGRRNCRCGDPTRSGIEKLSCAVEGANRSGLPQVPEKAQTWRQKKGDRQTRQRAQEADPA